MKSLLATAIRLLVGDDVFLSYSRADGANYAAKLATQLAVLGYSVRFDQWGAAPGASLPTGLVRALRRSSLFVLVSTAAAGDSRHVETEIRAFIQTGRPIVPIDLDGTIRSAGWWPLLDGLAVSAPAPFDEVVDRIRNTRTFTRRNVRLARVALATGFVLAALLTGIVFATKRAAGALAKSQAMTVEAENQTALATRAAEERRTAEGLTKSARGEALASQAAATEASHAAASADDARKLAEGAAATERSQAADAAVTRQQAETARDNALHEMDVAQRERDNQRAVADSQELARLAKSAGVSIGEILGAAIRSAEAAPTEAARLALIDALARTRMSGSGSVTFDRAGQFLAVIGADGGGFIENTRDRRRTVLCGAAEGIELLSFSPDGRWLLVARTTPRYDGTTFELWDPARGARVGAAQANIVVARVGVPTAFWLDDGSAVAVKSEKAFEMAVVNVDNKGTITASSRDLHGHNRINVNPKRRIYLSYDAAAPNELSLSNFSGDKLWSKAQSGFERTAFSPDGTYAVTVSSANVEVLHLGDDGKPKGVETIERTAVRSLQMHGVYVITPPRQGSRKDSAPKVVRDFDCSPLGGPWSRISICLQGTQTPRLFDAVSRKVSAVLSPWSRGIAMYADVNSTSDVAAVLAYGGADGKSTTVSAWNVKTGTELWAIPVAERGTRGAKDRLQFSRDGKRLFVDMEEQNFAVFEVPTGRELARLPLKGWLYVLDQAGTLAAGSGITETQLWRVGETAPYASASSVPEERMQLEQQAIMKDGTVEQLLGLARARLFSCASDEKTPDKP